MSGALVRVSGEAVSRPRPNDYRIWALAVLVGASVGLLVVILRTLVAYGEFVFWGAAGGRLPASLSWQARMIPPVVGGALVSLLLRVGVSQGWGPAPHPFGLGDVFAARLLRGPLRATTLALRDSFLSILAVIVSLGAGGAAGREEPAAHLGASVAMLPGRLLGLDLADRRLLLGMGVAAALAGALHAPIAAMFLARELLLPRVRLVSLGPLMLTSLVGWLIALWAFEGRPAIALPAIGETPIFFQFAAPLVAAIVAPTAWAALMLWRMAPPKIAALAGRLRMPVWILPAIGGVALGLLALAVPRALGVGYATLSAGLGAGGPGAGLGLGLMLGLALAKAAAAALTFSFRWGGGAIAPTLFLGGMVGGACGLGVGFLTDQAFAGQAFFGVLGMGVALAVLLDAPIPAALLVFELSASPALAAATLTWAFAAVLVVRRLARPPPEPRRPAP
ncbi:MAG: chloride channel protein [Alphaproteobacteria bacterium]|nr:chloride channel protein [Alphaproteobacteria bacterium]